MVPMNFLLWWWWWCVIDSFRSLLFFLARTKFIFKIPIISFSNYKATNHRTIVPFIVVTHDDNDTHHQMQSISMDKSTMPSINMDNISLKGIKTIHIYWNNRLYFILKKDYFNSTPCPGSPTLPDKLLSSTSTTATLSLPGAIPIPASTGSKRRGLGLTSNHRASYKRAHTGRLVRRF